MTTTTNSFSLSCPPSADFSLFVGDLAPDVTDIILQEYFRQFYPSVRSAKVGQLGSGQRQHSAGGSGIVWVVVFQQSKLDVGRIGFEVVGVQH